jgi:hypothetical protein
MSLEGDLSELPLASLIEMTSLGSKTGLVLLWRPDGAEAGRLVFRDGRLVGAACGALGPEKAFYALLAVKEGSFRFEPTSEVGEEQCNLPTATLLMEGMRRIDELAELRRSLPAPAYAHLLGGDAGDALEARVLGYLGPGARTVGDIVEGVLVGADADEYDALKTLARLQTRGVIRIGGPPVTPKGGHMGPPQPELER